MTDMPTTQPATFLPGGGFPPPKPFNFDPHTGLPIEYDEFGAPYSPIVFVTAPELPDGVTGYDPYTGKPLDEHGHPVHGEHNPFGQHTFTTRLDDRGGVDPAGHVIAQRPLYSESTGLPITYDEHGIGMVIQIGVHPPPGVAGYDPYTGEPLDEHGDVVPGVGNPHRLPEYDPETGLPITYDADGNPLVPNIHVINPDGVHGYDPITGAPLDQYGEPVEGAVNPNWRPEDRPEPEPESYPNFDPVTGVPLEYDENGDPYPAVELDGPPTLPDGVAGYDPYTGEPVDEHGNVVDGADNPHGDHTFTTNLDGREGVDPSGHVVAQRPQYDEESGLPIYYDSHGTPHVFDVDTEKPEWVDHYDEKTGDPLDEHGNVVEGIENPYQRPNYDTSTGRPVQYDQNGYQVPQPPVYLPPQDGVASYDPRTGEPRDEYGQPVDGVTNPWLLDENDLLYPRPWVPTPEPVVLPPEEELVHQPLVTPAEEELLNQPLVAPEEELGDTLPTEPLEPGVPDDEPLVDPPPAGLGEPGDVFGSSEGPVETTEPATEPSTGPAGPTAEKVAVPEQRDTDDADPFAHAEKPTGTVGASTKDSGADDDEPAVRDEPASQEPVTEPAASHESASLDAPDTGADAADEPAPVAAG